jgi:hypothetical protein
MAISCAVNSRIGHTYSSAIEDAIEDDCVQIRDLLSERDLGTGH